MRVSPIDFSFYIRKGDTAIPLKITIKDTSACDAFDLTGYSAVFSMAIESDNDDIVISDGLVNITTPSDGEAEYRWQEGDTDTVGRYNFVFKFTKDGKTFTVPTISPGVVVVQRTI